MFFERCSPIPSPKAIQSDDGAGPVFECIPSEGPDAVRIRIAKHLIRDQYCEIVFAGQREKVSNLSGDSTKGIALLTVVEPLESIKPRCTVDGKETRSFGKSIQLPYCLFLFLETEGITNDNLVRNDIEVHRSSSSVY